MSCGHDAEHFPAPAAQLQNKSGRGKALRILGWVWGQLGLSWVHITAWKSVPLTHPWDNIQQHLGLGMSLGCTTQKQRWGGDVLLHHHAPSTPVRFHEGRCAVKSMPAIPALMPVVTMQDQPVPEHHQCLLEGMPARLLSAISNAGPVPAFISLESLDKQSSASQELSKGKAHQRPAWEQQLERGRKPKVDEFWQGSRGSTTRPSAAGMEHGWVFQGHQELSCDGHPRWKSQLWARAHKPKEVTSNRCS